MSLGNSLRQARENKGWTQTYVAKLLGITNQALSNWERGERDPDTPTLNRLAELYGVTTDWLLRKSDIGKEAPASIDILNILESPNTKLSVGGRPLTQEQRITILRTLNQDNPPAGSNKLPIVGTVRAGLPILTEGNITGYLDVPAKTQADFAVQIRGDSMILAGVHEGDYAVCRQTDVAYTGQMVVAAVRDNVDWGGTIKYFVQANGTKILRAANPDYEDIHLGSEDRIVGLVVALLKDPPGMHIYEKLVTAVAGRSSEWAALAQTAANYGLRPKEIEKLVELFAHVVKQVKE